MEQFIKKQVKKVSEQIKKGTQQIQKETTKQIKKGTEEIKKETEDILNEVMGGAQVSKQRQPYICTHPVPDFTCFKNKTIDWIKELDDEKYISSINIPGTHQSLSREGGYASVITVAQCQSWSIRDQLNAGIRCFDLRGKCKKGKMKGYHGIVDQKIDVQSAFKDFFYFLDQFPSEFLIVKLKEEDNKTPDKYITETFNNMISKQEFQIYFFMENRIPKIKEVRQKIFFIPRWDYPDGGYRTSLTTQDRYNVEPSDKLKHIENFRNKSLEHEQIDNGKKLILNYLSGATVKNWPLTYAKMGNKQFYQNHISRGIIMMDFPGEYLIDKILGLNKHSPEQLKAKNIQKIQKNINQQQQNNGKKGNGKQEKQKGTKHVSNEKYSVKNLTVSQQQIMKQNKVQNGKNLNEIADKILQEKQKEMQQKQQNQKK